MAISNSGPSQLDFHKNGNLKSLLEKVLGDWGALTKMVHIACRGLKMMLQKPSAIWTDMCPKVSVPKWLKVPPKAGWLLLVGTGV